VAALLLATATAHCSHSGGTKLPEAGSVDADKYLYEHGNASLQTRHWIEAREYFKKLFDTYPGSTYREDAKLGVGDSYMGEKRIDSDILAVNEFREFLRFFPRSARADYAQFRICTAQSRQMLGPQRDQTATRDAIRECDVFVKTYPGSELHQQGVDAERAAQDRLSDAAFEVGMFYFRAKYYLGALDRFMTLLHDDPSYTHKDQLYYYIAETLYRAKNTKEALPYYERLVTEFEKSEYLKRAQSRIAELKR
jgi:outer membrane protein assembly factor BamD